MPTLNVHEPSATLAECAYTLIKQRIFNFDLMPGDRFSELELAQQVHVSRTPLRQALQRLQREGFMQVFQKSGWLAAPLDFDQFDELYDFRVLIEYFAVRHLCGADDRPSWQVRFIPGGDSTAGSRAEEVCRRTSTDLRGRADLLGDADRPVGLPASCGATA